MATFIKDFRIDGNRTLTHLVFWAVFLLINGLVWAYIRSFDYGTDNPAFYLQPLNTELLNLPSWLFGVYVNLYVLIPQLLVTKKYTRYLVSFAVLYVVTSIMIRYVHIHYANAIFPSYSDNQGIWDLFLLGRVAILHLAPIMLITTIIKLWQMWYYQQKNSQALMKEKMEAELNYLKAQVHPHFLFNTLNNLYSLTLQKSDAAPNIVLKLSELISYMLYDSQANSIALQKEIEHVQNYITLEKLRYGNRLDVSFNVSGNTDRRQIAPLLLVPFVENAFKHGASNEIKNAWITIDLKIKDRMLIVKVENSKSNGMIAHDRQSYRNGIGLRNVQRRLDLLYPGNHELNIEDDSAHYAVDLKLTLTENQPA